jgi:hypothetical protein
MDGSLFSVPLPYMKNVSRTPKQRKSRAQSYNGTEQFIVLEQAVGIP